MTSPQDCPGYISIYSSNNLSHQILRPAGLINSISSGADVVLQVNLAPWVSNDRLWAQDIPANCTGMPLFEKLWSQNYVSCVCFQHLHEPWQSVAHIVIVSEDLLSIAGPDICPDFRGIDTHTVDEPLRVVVECNLILSDASRHIRLAKDYSHQPGNFRPFRLV